MSSKFFNNNSGNTILDKQDGIDSEMVSFETDTNNIINDLQNMCNSVLVLYDAHAKDNQELKKLANLAYYLLWNYSKSMIELQMLLNASLPCEKDFAKGQLCITINECLKHVIGFETNQRKNSLWVKDMGEYILKQPEMKKQYSLIKDGLSLYADSFEKDCSLQEIRKLATHGDKEIDNLMKIRNLSHSEVFRYLTGWEKSLTPAANFAFSCFENECQQEINKRKLYI